MIVFSVNATHRWSDEVWILHEIWNSSRLPLAGWPVHLSSPEKVKVKMINRLASARPIIDHKSEPILEQTFLFSNKLCGVKKLTKNFTVLFFSLKKKTGDETRKRIYQTGTNQPFVKNWGQYFRYGSKTRLIKRKRLLHITKQHRAILIKSFKRSNYEA